MIGNQVENKFKYESAKKNKKKHVTADIVMYVCFYFICILFGLLCLYPFLQVLISSFADETTLLIEGYKLIPSKFSLQAYKVVFNGSTIMDAYGITIFITVVGTIIQVIITAMAAYALSGVYSGTHGELSAILQYF